MQNSARKNRKGGPERNLPAPPLHTLRFAKCLLEALAGRPSCMLYSTASRPFWELVSNKAFSDHFSGRSQRYAKEFKRSTIGVWYGGRDDQLRELSLYFEFLNDKQSRLYHLHAPLPPRGTPARASKAELLYRRRLATKS